MREGGQTVAILIAALGGEGGGTLADWVAGAIRAAGLPCQSTSIPGVAQRTGATTYYIEFCTVPLVELGDRRPVLALTPVPGRVDVMIASELLEAARAVQNGYVTPERTSLIASTHRVYAIGEKIAMTDGRFDAATALTLVHDRARRALLFDMERATAEAGTVISAVLLGAVAASGAIGIDPALFEAQIAAGGKGVEASLRGYRLGSDAVRSGVAPGAAQTVDAGEDATLDHFPMETRFVLGSGVDRTRDYQDQAHAQAYLRLVRQLLDADRAAGGASRGWRLTIEGARHLALRMTYEDVIRVADLKTRPERFARLRAEMRAAPDQPVRVTEFLKPGPEELCALLPPRLAERFLAVLRRRGIEHRFNVGLHLRSDTLFGFALLRLVASLRLLRRGSWRYAQETALTDRWLAAVLAAAAIDYEFAIAVAESVDLVKGYSATYRRGRANYELILSRVIEPALVTGCMDAAALRAVLRSANADPDGEALALMLARPMEEAAPAPVAA